MLRVSSDLRRSSSGFMAYPLSEGQLGFRFPVGEIAVSQELVQQCDRVTLFPADASEIIESTTP
jgi:hypothetical protein